jgi:hypothetical protein
MRLGPTIVSLALALMATLAWGAENPYVVLISLDTFRSDRLASWGGPASPVGLREGSAV